jgi:hypothetical protein
MLYIKCWIIPFKKSFCFAEKFLGLNRKAEEFLQKIAFKVKVKKSFCPSRRILKSLLLLLQKITT